MDSEEIKLKIEINEENIETLFKMGSNHEHSLSFIRNELVKLQEKIDLIEKSQHRHAEEFGLD